ncbi:MAG TPA: hypothetical protein VHT96_16875 [Clostridia bacterium]|nr:hypothetical protein [Clostridia bacterium]
MKIMVDNGRYHFTFPVPIGIIAYTVTNHLVAGILNNEKSIPVKAKDLSVLFNELKRAKKTFGRLLLVDIETSSGQRIKITL